MSSKAKLKLQDVLKQNKKLRNERQRLVRTLCAIIHHQGPITIPFVAATLVEETDQVEVKFNKNDGSYTVCIRGESDAEPMGSGSGQAGLHVGEGDVAGLVPEGEPNAVIEEVREGDQLHPSEDSSLRSTNPE